MGRGLHQHSVELINASIDILREIQPTTVRGVGYQLFIRGFTGSMAKSETAKVSRLLTLARERGEISWDWIVDETREVEQASQWHDGEHFIDSVMRQYRKDYWQDQTYCLEVLSEKGTIRGVLAPVLDEFGVPFRVMHGFASATAANDIARSIVNNDRAHGKDTILLYVGDFDPSGLYMSEVDLRERIERYGAEPGFFELRRIAITEADVKSDKLPSFTAASKKGDVRYEWFTKRHGHACVEVDAMNPNDLRKRVRDSILEYLDADAWQHMIRIEQGERESMQKVMTEWSRAMGNRP